MRNREIFSYHKVIRVRPGHRLGEVENPGISDTPPVEILTIECRRRRDRFMILVSLPYARRRGSCGQSIISLCICQPLFRDGT